MTSRAEFTAELNHLEQDLKALAIAYEQYFMGVEKREPFPLRQKLTRQIRALVNRYVPQTDLRFRMQSISSRFHSYTGHWDRILRLIDEGKYERHTAKIQRSASKPPVERPQEKPDPLDSLYEKLAEAHHNCGMKIPSRQQVHTFLARQQELIREKFGERNVDFVVVTENNKPKIKVRAKGR